MAEVSTLKNRKGEQEHSTEEAREVKIHKELDNREYDKTKKKTDMKLRLNMV